MVTGVPFRCVGGGVFIDVVGYVGALVAQVDAPAHLVSAIGEGGVGRQIGQQEDIARLHGDRDRVDLQAVHLAGLRGKPAWPPVKC